MSTASPPAVPSALNLSNLNSFKLSQVCPVKADFGRSTLFQEPGVTGTSTKNSPAPVPPLLSLIGVTLIISS